MEYVVKPESLSSNEQWAALIRGRVVGVGQTPAEAEAAARRNRPRERIEAVVRLDDPLPSFSVNHLWRQTIEFLAHWPRPVYLVGGALRDLLLDRPLDDIRDLDLVTDRDALSLGKALADHLAAAYFPLDETRGTARVTWPAERFPTGAPTLDIAQFRGPDPFHTSLLTDLQSRDFTINALALPLNAESQTVTTSLTYNRQSAIPNIIDPGQGLADLADHRLRAVCPTVFGDDPIRLLRAVRLAAELHFDIEPETERLIRAAAALITRPAAERLRAELVRLIGLPDAATHLHRLDALGLLSPLLPELDPLRGCIQPNVHYWDVFEHSLQSVTGIEICLAALGISGYTFRPPLPTITPDLLSLEPYTERLRVYLDERLTGGHSRLVLLKLCALIHDLGKPATRTVEPNGRIHFFGHAETGVDLAGGVMRRLRFSNAETGFVTTVIAHHLRPAQLAMERETITRRAINHFFRDTGTAGPATLIHSLADHLAIAGPTVNRDDLARHAAGMRAMLAVYYQPDDPADKKTARPVPLLNGHDVMNVLNLPPGETVGQILTALQSAQAAGQIKDREEALHWLRGLSRDRQPSATEK